MSLKTNKHVFNWKVCNSSNEMALYSLWLFWRCQHFKLRNVRFISVPALRGCSRRLELVQRTGVFPCEGQTACVSAQLSTARLRPQPWRRGGRGAPGEKTRSRGWAWRAERINQGRRRARRLNPPGPRLPVFLPLPANDSKGCEVYEWFLENQSVWSVWQIGLQWIDLEPNFTMMMGPGDREACG